MGQIENGVHDLTNEQYHRSSGVSRSSLMKLKQSPMHYQFDRNKIEPNESTPAMVMGELIHTKVLEPGEYDKRYYVTTPCDKRTKAGKEDWLNQQKLAEGKTIISLEQAMISTQISESVASDLLAHTLLEDCVMEKSIYFTHEPTGLQCKVRPDAWNGVIVVDLKTTVDASFRGFQGSAAKYGYFLQAGMIHQALKSIGIAMERFIFIAVEKEPPYAVGIFVLDGEALDYGVNQFNQLMQKLDKCTNENAWPSYGIQNLTLPGWTKYEEIE